MSALEASRPLRCAVYTRKSSEEGLDQAFNSLHAQRDAGEAYVKSQAGEGWNLLERAYDDGGFSGGTLDRPGLKQLLADIKAGQVDVVVVYKVDRLTRSLGDFARIVEIFDKAGVSFVSITQSFNTTTSMGRLTLNVLLSFAQFEREVTGERIRDKIAASKAKGMWMGGCLPLGYDAVARELVINEVEAAQVRFIFKRYLELGSVHRLRVDLEQSGVRSKPRLTRRGEAVPGQVLARGALFHLLQNRHYLGEITHRGASHPGLHPPIVDHELFDAVQSRLAENRIAHSGRALRSHQALLNGRIFDSRGRPMSPAFGYRRRGKVYRYYVAAGLLRGEALDRPLQEDRSLPPQRLPAPSLEAYLLDLLQRWTGRTSADWAELSPILNRLEVGVDRVHVLVDSKAAAEHGNAAALLEEIKGRLVPGEQIFREADGHSLRLVAPGRLQFRGGRTWRERPSLKQPGHVDVTLLKALKEAHAIAAAHGLSPHVSTPFEQPRAPKYPYHRRLCRLVFLAPDIQAAIVDGRQPYDLTIGRLIDEPLPPGWAEQRLKFGFPAQ